VLLLKINNYYLLILKEDVKKRPIFIHKGVKEIVKEIVLFVDFDFLNMIKLLKRSLAFGKHLEK